MDAVLPRPPCPVLAELLAVVAELERLEAERPAEAVAGEGG